MSEPFKNLFNEQLIDHMAEHLAKQWSDFNQDAFKKTAKNSLDSLELKQRSSQISAALSSYLPENFAHASEILICSLGKELKDEITISGFDKTGISGWAVMPMADYVAENGMKHFDLSMSLLKELTKRSTSEFAIRPFIVVDPIKTMETLMEWADDLNQHVRRLASEGCRPRLPWGIRLQVFVKDPVLVIKLLEKLKDDSEEYVRRSVANNLNDIAKDHPDLVAKIAEDWLKDASKNRKRLVKHACRTLIKQGHQPTLAALGYKPAKLKSVKLMILRTQVSLGETLEFSLEAESSLKEDQPLIVDYIVHHQKANGSLSPKVFKWTTKKLIGKKSLFLNKKHSMNPVTTRKYYSGLHRLEVLINGEVFASKEFMFT